MRWIPLTVLCIGVGLLSYGAPAQKQPHVTTVDFELRFGLIVLDVSMNGIPKKFVLDTGCDMTILTAKAADELGLKAIEGYSTRLNEMNASFVRVDSLAVGDLIRSNHLCIVAEISECITLAGDDVAGALGQDFLSQYTVTVDYGQKRLGLTWRHEQDSLFVDPQFGLEVKRPDSSWAFETQANKPKIPVVLTRALASTDVPADATVLVNVNECEEQDQDLDVAIPVLEQLIAATFENLELGSSVRKKWGDRDCHVMRFTGADDGVQRQFMMVSFFASRFFVTLSCSAPPDEFADLADEFEAIVESIRFVQQDGADSELSPGQLQEEAQ